MKIEERVEAIIRCVLDYGLNENMSQEVRNYVRKHLRGVFKDAVRSCRKVLERVLAEEQGGR